MKQKTKNPFTKSEERFIRRVVRERTKLGRRYPLVFGLLITFGLVSTLYGFEKLIDRMELFSDNPWILLTMGVMTLIATGAAYTKLH